MPALRIQSGRYRNRPVKLPPSVHGHSEFTPQKVKEAVFQLLENSSIDYTEAGFIELYAGSGQMGFEAYSRGFSHITFNEWDRQRLKHLIQLVSELGFEETAFTFTRRDGVKALRRHLSESVQPAVIFADPPWLRGRGGWKTFASLIAEIQKYDGPGRKLFIVQVPEQKYLPAEFNPAESADAEYDYGSVRILLFREKV